MKDRFHVVVTVPLCLFILTSVAHGQTSGGVYWHIDPSVKTCSMVIDPSLTQDQWRRYTRQVGEIATFKSLASAKNLGKKHLNFAFDYSITPVDQQDPAWINTFTHPDADCPLGDQIKLPTLRLKYGVTDKLDIGALWTTAPGANYGMVGGELKYAILQESEKLPAAAVRGSFILLTGVPDYNLSINSLELLVSKKIFFLTPYLGIRESFVIGAEKTSKVDLDRENLLTTQGYAGLAYSFWKLNAAVEYNISNVNTFTFLIGFQIF